MQQRYHALDNLRGIIMWLGIVIHVSMNHMVGENLIPWRDTQTGPLADLVLIFIHTFRMPLFFILGGFFVALLIQKYGSKAMLKNRMQRLATPFMIFWPILLISTTILGMMFLSKATHGYISIDPGLRPENPKLPTINTIHLWFLYCLFIFCLLAAVAQLFLERISVIRKQKMGEKLANLACSGWGSIILTLPLVAIGSVYEFGILTPSCSLIPNIFELTHHGLYFIFGWLLFNYSHKLMEHYQRYCWHYTIAGAFMFMAVLITMGMIEQDKLAPEYQRVAIAFNYNIIGWLWSFAIIGIFTRYLDNRNGVLRYLADSSYWVYLTHLPWILGFGILLYDTSLGLVPKMLTNIVLTSGVCLLSYHFLVRFTWLGKLLNGRRQHKNLSITQASEISAT